MNTIAPALEARIATLSEEKLIGPVKTFEYRTLYPDRKTVPFRGLAPLGQLDILIKTGDGSSLLFPSITTLSQTLVIQMPSLIQKLSQVGMGPPS